MTGSSGDSGNDGDSDKGKGGSSGGDDGSTCHACFLEGTKLATLNGAVAVQDLAIGDLLLLQSGAAMPVRWIGHRSYDLRFARNNPDVLPIRIKASALAAGIPSRDLLVSPNHAMLIDGVLIHAGELVNGRSVQQVTELATFAYFHVELSQHAIILAEDAPTESYIDAGNRAAFHNAADYYSLYPDARASNARAEIPACCAPMINDGPIVEAARKRIALRAGLAPDNDAQALGLLRGHIDHVGSHLVEGWAQDDSHRDVPVRLAIYDGGVLVAHTVADRYRGDLAQAGVSQGRAGFRVILPPAAEPRLIDIRRVSDGTLLPGSVSAEIEAHEKAAIAA